MEKEMMYRYFFLDPDVEQQAIAELCTIPSLER